ncbi:MAG: Purine nucleoside phosphorylase (EC [uncultured Aureispira sp.]|uniref:Uridine phosphorylase n=1 Tax=uncultured Aureispira sp. TaxID=1331704 RepID=A0A6S6UI47_9BACT|nr:MAG: Purine nucleoside phosphorylase (EC [uncultured Aureispira sp.]
MSLHIGAKEGEIAEKVLLPGDPLRAKWVAETFLEDSFCYNTVRGMNGYTGTYKGQKVSVQGTGMGIPSTSIYVNELISSYGAKQLIRIGTAGSYQADLKIRDIVLAMSASTDSAINRRRFNGMDFAPTADFGLFMNAVRVAEGKGIQVKAGNILSADEFYNDNFEVYKHWAKYGVLCVEMETTAIYTLAAKFGVQALTILTISDELVTGIESTAQERQETLSEMVEIALEI